MKRISGGEIEKTLLENDRGFNSPIDFEGVESVAKAQLDANREEIREELVKIAKTIKDNKAGALFLAQTRPLRQTLKQHLGD